MAEQDQPQDAIGIRVRTARKLAGITQTQLAERAHVSLSLVKQVEQVRVPASPAFVAAVARALDVPIGDLLFGRPATADHEARRIHSIVPALRRELAAARLPPEADAPVRSLRDLSAAVGRASALRHAVALDELGSVLPGLLAELRAAAHHYTGHNREVVHGLLFEAYAAADQVVWKLGYHDLSSLATTHIEHAADESGDPLARAAADFRRAGELIITAEWRGALTFLDAARNRITDLVATGDEAALAMHGILHLKSGLAASHAGDADASDAHWAEAREAAEHVTSGSDHYRLAFDADSVAIWGVALAVERYDGTEAVKRADKLHFAATTPRERIGHHWIDLARGFQLHGDRERSLKALQLARRVAPQQTRFHPQVRETLVTLAEQDRRRSDTLSGFARWAGIRL